jgi:hypothetical protein
MLEPEEKPIFAGPKDFEQLNVMSSLIKQLNEMMLNHASCR